MDGTNLSWRVEEACLNAWPSSRVALAGGWLIRASGGPTRRTNSVNPLRSTTFDPASILPEARRLYKALGQPVIFRVPSIAVGLDEALAREGFTGPEAETTTLYNGTLPHGADRGVDLLSQPMPAWLQARARLNAADARASDVYERMLGLVCGPIQFASLSLAGRIEAIAYGALSRDLLVIESVATSPDMRRRGLAREVVGALMGWAARRGVVEACLQVMSDNTPAIGLYQSLGFTRELYRYHYRRQ